MMTVDDCAAIFGCDESSRCEALGRCRLLPLSSGSEPAALLHEQSAVMNHLDHHEQAGYHPIGNTGYWSK